MSQYKDRLFEIIFESDTPAGKRFDLLLIISIILSVFVVLIDSVDYYAEELGYYHTSIVDLTQSNIVIISKHFNQIIFYDA